MPASNVDLSSTPVNNQVYHSLGERWYEATDDPIALLRAESRLRNPWIIEALGRTFDGRRCRVLDVGCGGGFLSNSLGAAGHDVQGLDASEDALRVAALHDSTHSVRYRQGNALQLPYDSASFDAVCAMDFLEHVEDPRQVIAEAARVLKPSGSFFFHTFNRNFMSWLIVIKGVEWFVRNTPKDLHVLRLFLKPEEVRDACAEHGLGGIELRGVRPKFGLAFWRLLATGRVRNDFAFTFTRSTRLGYSGVARKSEAAR
ncbi:MAG: bifunctional 2-polyprenyl-6-hydroxyphenol methylase/3-demethylubiquinol 3-O-methyltransferase UbiG [Polyangiaceae bacterium]